MARLKSRGSNRQMYVCTYGYRYRHTDGIDVWLDLYTDNIKTFGRTHKQTDK